MNRRQKRGNLLILTGLLLILAAMALRVMAQKQDALVGEKSRILMKQLALNRISIEEAPEDVLEEPIPADRGIVDTSMPVKNYLGYSMIGILRIPTVGIELPILNTWSEELLDVAPCRYFGSIPSGNMIFMGHNYQSHFGSLRDLTVGEKVEFEDVNGVKYQYVVEEMVYLHRSEGEKLPSEYELTVFTCTPGGLQRIVVRCRRIN